MSCADKLFIANCKDIIENGYSDEGMNVRPHWGDDGSPAHTVKLFGVVNRYNLKEEFPIMTIRKQFIKSALPKISSVIMKFQKLSIS